MHNFLCLKSIQKDINQKLIRVLKYKQSGGWGEKQLKTLFPSLNCRESVDLLWAIMADSVISVAINNQQM